MGNLIAVAYPSQNQATQALATLERLQAEHVLDLHDAVVVTRTDDGKVQLRQTVPVAGERAITGSLWGLLVGTFFLAPVVGAAVGAASGALSNTITDFGIDDDFARGVGGQLQPGGIALVLLVRRANAERVVAAMRPFGGTLLRSSLSPEAEAWLREELSAGADPQEAIARLSVSLNDEVRCADGDGGAVSRVIVNPQTRKLSHLVVREPRWRGIERIVPIELAEEGGPGVVRLRLTLAELTELPSYEVTEYISSTNDVSYMPVYATDPYSTEPFLHSPIPVTHENLPEGEIAVRHGDHVEATDGRAGSVDDLLTGADGTIGDLVLRHGHLWGAREIVIPIAEVDHVADGVVYLKLSKDQINKL